MSPALPNVPPSYLGRLTRIRMRIAESGLDSLLVTHPPNLRYLTGFDGSMGALLVEMGRSTLLVDGRYATAARTRIAGTPDLQGTMIVLVEGSHEIAIGQALRTAGVQRIGIEGAAMTVSRYDRLRAALGRHVGADGPGPQLVPVEGIVEEARVVKDEAEIATLRAAAGMLSGVAAGILPSIRAGRTEQDIAAEVDAALRRAGFERPAFDTIVASGPNSALPHARPGRRVLEPGDGVVLDFGGVHDGYCVDLTRTVQLAPAAEPFTRMFDAVRAAHAAAVAVVAPGVRASAVDAAARHMLIEHGLGEAFLHGTGHGLGLEIHERPRITRVEVAGEDELLASGMVFTIEPGAYVAGLGGVRIEDDVLVVDGGCEVLTDVPVSAGLSAT